jgi:hypothetical protein
MAVQDATMLAHNVYFALQDNSAEAKQALIEASKKYLTDHPGIVLFAVGELADYEREVNDRDFDVSLHVTFKDRAAHDAYQADGQHLEFIAAMKENWKKVRVFDTDVTGA